jgi:hypothetical protein
MSHMADVKLSAHYQAGVSARTWGNAKVPPGVLNWRDRHWWLGGWNDRDIEIQAKNAEKLPT